MGRTFEPGFALHVPMYAPMTADEQLLVGLLRDAYRRDAEVAIRSRTSPFRGVEVVTELPL